MFRITILVRRNKTLAPPQFHPLWLNTLAPQIATSLRNCAQLRRLVVNIAPNQLEPEIAKVFPPMYDGLLELWFETSEAAAAAVAKLSAETELKQRAQTIVDADQGAMWLAQVIESKPDQGSRVKFMAAGDIALGVTLEEAHRYWRDEHPKVAQTAPDVWQKLTRYTQFHGRQNPQLSPDNGLAKPRFVAMCSDMGFAQQSDFIALYTCDQYQQIVRPDEEKFSRPGEMLAFISADEHDLF